MSILHFVNFTLTINFALLEDSTVDPWIYSQRLFLYETILNNTNINLYNNNNESNILWGLPLQFTWQMSSGRLFVNNQTKRLSGNGWWACMNYYLSVIPYIYAAEVGIVPKVNILPPIDNDPSKFCLNSVNCSTTLGEKWTNFYNLLKTYQNKERKRID